MHIERRDVKRGYHIEETFSRTRYTGIYANRKETAATINNNADALENTTMVERITLTILLCDFG